MDGWINEWMSEWMSAWVNGWIDRWMGGFITRNSLNVIFLTMTLVPFW